MWSTVLALSVREKNGTKNPYNLNCCLLLGLIWFKIIRIERTLQFLTIPVCKANIFFSLESSFEY